MLESYFAIFFCSTRWVQSTIKPLSTALSCAVNISLQYQEKNSCETLRIKPGAASMLGSPSS